MTQSPLVSAVMPTKDRAAYAPLAIACFLGQTYAERELVIMEDGRQSIEHLIPADPRIRYIKMGPGYRTLGAKRNYLAAEARGEIIIHWDDDDWSAPGRMAAQVAYLLASGKAVTGYHRIYYWDEQKGKAFQYRFSGPGPYACGTSQCYLRSFWAKHSFPLMSFGEDSKFSHAASMQRQLTSVDGGQMMVVRHHAASTSHPNLGAFCFPAVDRKELPAEFFLAITQSLNRPIAP